ncbi:MAG: flagellar biosynthesis protein FlhB [Pirellulaceae bacterium]|nr:flagellar biosynthesis protein FlhB [Pirellulaceae bacterium]
MAADDGEKSQDPTPHRREKAREEGQVAKSQDLSSAVVLLGAVLLLMFWGESIVEFMLVFTKGQLQGDFAQVVDSKSVAVEINSILLGLSQVLLPLLVGLMIVGMLSNIGQVGFLFLPKKLNPDFSKLSLIKGLKRLFSIASYVRLGFGIFKVIVVGAVGFLSLWNEWETILDLGSKETLAIGAYLFQTVLWTSLYIAIALLILAIFDYMFQSWKHEQEIKMTTQEVREEMKQLQGDPQIIAQRRQVQRQMELNRMSSSVPEADVVITNPTELAIALKYDINTMIAPTIVAKGAGLIAQKIRRLALENNVPIVERKPLARALYADAEIGDVVPAEQYAAVAEVLRYVYELKGKKLPALS